MDYNSLRFFIEDIFYTSIPLVIYMITFDDINNLCILFNN